MDISYKKNDVVVNMVTILNFINKHIDNVVIVNPMTNITIFAL